LCSNRRSADQTRESSSQEKCVQLIFHVYLTSLGVLGGEAAG
jgi:hypothetical protein